MKKALKFFAGFLVLAILVCGLTIGGSYIYVRSQMAKNQKSYTDTVEDIILQFVPDEGITVRGRTYDYWSVKNFLEEIRYNPYNYIHKDHHCVLQYVPQERIYWIVTLFRTVMGCG